MKIQIFLKSGQTLPPVDVIEFTMKRSPISGGYHGISWTTNDAEANNKLVAIDVDSVAAVVRLDMRVEAEVSE